MTTATPVKTMAYRQEDGAPWIGLPAVLNDGSKSNAEMIEDAGLLNWDIRLDEVISAAKVDSPSYEVLRTDPADGLPHRLAIVGTRYHEVQNEALIAMADNITDGDATLVAAGHYQNGRRVFLSFELGENIVFDPEGSADAIGRHLTIMAGHDGGLGIGFFTHAMRLRCQNMLTSIRMDALGSFKARHTQNVEGRILEARKSLSMGFKATDEWEKEMKALWDVPVKGVEGFSQIVEGIFPRPEKDVKGSLAKWENKTGAILGLWSGATLNNVPDNAYKAYNALNEHLMWGSTVRAGNVEGALVKASGFDETTNKANLGLYRKVLALTA